MGRDQTLSPRMRGIYNAQRLVLVRKTQAATLLNAFALRESTWFGTRIFVGSTPACIENCVLFYMKDAFSNTVPYACLVPSRRLKKGQLSKHLVKVYTAISHIKSRPVIVIGFATTQPAEAAWLAKFMHPAREYTLFLKGAHCNLSAE